MTFISISIRFWVFSILVLLSMSAKDTKSVYSKEYYDHGQLKSEGWLKDNLKSGYWKFYYKNGSIAYQGHFRKGQKEDYWYFYHPDRTLKKEGHFKGGVAVNWWIYYNSKGHIIHKCQLEEGVKNGYCLKYVNQKLTSAEKYVKGRKINEWHTFSNFKRDNNLSDLK